MNGLDIGFIYLFYLDIADIGHRRRVGKRRLGIDQAHKKGGDFSALLYCAEHHGITADRKTKITEVSTETAEKCTVGCEMQ